MDRIYKTLSILTLLFSIQGLAETKPLAVGERIITDMGHTATVRRVTEKGTALIQIDGAHAVENEWDVERLARKQGCSTKDLCVDTSIITRNGQNSAVAGILPNGDLIVSYTVYLINPGEVVLYRRLPVSQVAKIK